MRPELIRETFICRALGLNEPFAGGNPPEAPKNRYIDRVFWMLRELTFADCSVTFVEYLVEVRIPSVAGRAFPISIGRPRERGKCC